VGVGLVGDGERGPPRGCEGLLAGAGAAVRRGRAPEGHAAGGAGRVRDATAAEAGAAHAHARAPQVGRAQGRTSGATRAQAIGAPAGRAGDDRDQLGNRGRARAQRPARLAARGPGAAAPLAPLPRGSRGAAPPTQQGAKAAAGSRLRRRTLARGEHWHPRRGPLTRPDRGLAGTTTGRARCLGTRKGRAKPHPGAWRRAGMGPGSALPQWRYRGGPQHAVAPAVAAEAEDEHGASRRFNQCTKIAHRLWDNYATPRSLTTWSFIDTMTRDLLTR
jgi:hypothetical protein